MKKFRSSLLALVICLALCLSLTACSGGSKLPMNGSDADTSDTDSGSQSGAGSVTKQIEDFIDKELRNGQLEEFEEAFEGVLSIEAFAKGSSMVLQYQYLFDLGVSNEQAASMLEETMDSLGESVKPALAALKISVPDAESLIVELLAIDGGVLGTREFK